MTPDVRRTLSRIALVCLAVGLVVAATWALTPRFDPKQFETADTARAPKHPPTPASQAALHQAIAQVQSGVPDYERLTAARTQILAHLTPLQHVLVALEGVSVPTHDEMLTEARQQQQDLKKFGPLQSVTYLGGGGRFDRYRVTFGNGALLWLVSVGKNGALADFAFGPEGVGTPQNFINNYARFSMRERWGRFVTQFAILLLAALFGRMALRLRL